MSFLVGQQGGGWTQVAASITQTAGNACYFNAGYLAAATGTMAAAHIQALGTSTTSSCVVYVYSGVVGGTTSLLATSGVINISANGDCFASISGAITGGALYTLMVQPPSGRISAAINSGSNNFKCNQNLGTTITYNSPPASIPPDDVNAGAEFIVWIDGVITGTGVQRGMGFMMAPGGNPC